MTLYNPTPTPTPLKLLQYTPQTDDVLADAGIVTVLVAPIITLTVVVGAAEVLLTE